ncbi:calcium calmodulin-dependent 3, 5 -cyclic nucleotide phosphodiesterase 1C-like protein [Labeo rohita]|uniref:Calcium calmodulin-dependent 3, 5-cyclic nucleotide phosphodiesterase 1C-like protein n=1 Tax=Labeo rohita TaxID=84645 RepID=A0A498LF71_LABRO|nr:calcium calmodulin-dependent 3, 5 -cyclic nucleotide phosphodiesterase 1C-like protein [Labeo rohita]RXN25261.1 calcium calmodulin-dependent 3, 5 -cyclic nucleotide phosphodiesterase 1C-like protein [Labeo rohita]
MGSVTSAFTRSRNTLVKVGSEPQKEPDGKTRSGSGVIAKQTSKQPLTRKTTGATRANTPQAPASATEHFRSVGDITDLRGI